MDLTGFRLLYRYPQEWRAIDACVRGGRLSNGSEISDPLFEDNNANYADDRLKDFIDDGNRDPFIAEMPKFYYLDTKKVVAAAYSLPVDAFVGFDHKDEIDSYISSRFKVIASPQGYRSIHYIINMQGKYIELQVRTIFDEAWAECGHDLIYKNEHHVDLNEELANIYNTTLAHQMSVSRDIAENMYSMINKKRDDADILLGLHRIMSRQIKVVGELNSHVAGYINKYPASMKKYQIMEQVEESTPDHIWLDEGTPASDLLP